MPRVKTTKWSPMSEQPKRNDKERNALFCEHCNSERDLAKWHASRFTERFPNALKIGTIDDWAQIARMSMLHAAAMWDDSKHVQFNTYASVAILRELEKVLRGGGVIRVPVNYRKSKHIHHDQAVKASKLMQLNDDFTKHLQYEQADIPETEDEVGKTHRLLNRLNPKHRRVVRERWLHGKTLEQIGKGMKITKERVRQLLFRAMERLRDITNESD